MLLATLFISTAFAGKLGDGWRGHPYGDAAWLAKAPGLHCKAHPEEAVAWTCWEVIGSQSYDVSYMVKENVYTSVLISCTNFTGCDQLFTILQAAWGECQSDTYVSGSLPDCGFGNEQGKDAPPATINGISTPALTVGTVFGRWNYNRFSDEGYAIAMSLDLTYEVEERKAAKARSAVEGL